MKKFKKFMFIFAVAIILLLGILFISALMGNKPTTGKKISKYENPASAVLVIDIQEDYTGATAKAPFPYKNSPILIERVNRIIKTAAAKKIHVVYIRQEFSGITGTLISKLFLKGTVIKGNPGTEIDARITRVSEKVFPKGYADSFSNPALHPFLIKNRVDRLYLVGLDAEHCIHKTALGALNRGYKVTIITDAIALYNMEKWDSIIKEYSAGGIQLITSSKF